MAKDLSRRLFLGTALGGALGGLAVGAQAGAPSVSLRPQMRPEGSDIMRPVARRLPQGEDPQALVDAANLDGKVAYAVVDVKTGALLETRNSSATFPPASVTKAITAIYAIRTLGAGYRFSTRLMATGALENGVIKGDLVLVGGGDPTLDTNALAAMAADLKGAGVTRVEGAFRVYDGALPRARVIDPAQPDHVGYNPAVSGLNLNYNRVHFQWVRAGADYQVTMDARSDKYRPAVRVARMSVVNRQTPIYTYSDAGDHDDWTVARAALGQAGTRWLPVRRPADYAGEVFIGFARAQGITLEGAQVQETAPEGITLVTHHSDALSDVLTGMLKYSNNLTAELVGLTATVARKGKAASIRASAREMTTWARRDLGLDDAVLVDHSGLGAESRMGAETLARALAEVQRDGVLAPMLKPVQMRHDNGQVNSAHPVKVLAKTGTLNFVSSLAGYAVAPNGTRLAFAIFTMSDSRRNGLPEASVERPPGAAAWNKRSKRLQQKLIERWAIVYAG